MTHSTAESNTNGTWVAPSPVPVFPFNPHDPSGSFPDDLLHDDWVAFHGTTGAMAEKIEADGFQWSEGQIAKSTIAQVVAIGERLVWAGPIQGGLSALSPFTLGFDFDPSDRKPIFFGESPQHSLRYALRETAGGETMDALRKTLGYFEMLLNEPTVRAERMAYLMRRRQDVFGDFTPDQLLALSEQKPEYYAGYAVEEIDMEWLGEQWASLATVRQRCQAVLDAHTHGAVFAVRLTEEDLAYLSWHRSMGILADGLVPSSRIVGKVVIPADAQANPFAEDRIAARRLDDLGGLYARLLARRI